MASPTNTDVNADDVARIVQALEEINGQISDLQAEKKIVLADAATLGLSKRVLGQVLARQKRERPEVLELDRTLRDYELALGLSVLM